MPLPTRGTAVVSSPPIIIIIIIIIHRSAITSRLEDVLACLPDSFICSENMILILPSTGSIS